MQLIQQKAGTLGVSETLYITLASPAQLVSIIVSNSSNVTVSATNGASPGASSLWSTLTLDANGVSINGPITGLKLVSNASGGTYSIAAAHLK